MSLKKILVSITLTFASSLSFALVDMNNAGYTNSWIDLEVPGTGYQMRVLRAYKSRTIYNGMFGFGQCSEFETKLAKTPEGQIKINECGDGQETLYSQREVTKKDVDTVISQIISKMKSDKRYSTNSPDYWKKLERQLIDDADMRIQYSSNVGIQVPVKENSKYMANGKEVENVVFQKTHYTRTFIDGSYQRFDLDGRLTHQYDKNGNYLKFEYQKDLLVEVSDNNARKLTFKYYPNKKVQRVTGPNGLMSEYKYNDQEDLIWNRNAWAKKETDVYTYEYNEFHNVTKITWPDKTFIALKYDNVKDWVLSFTDRDKCVENYKYDVSKSNPKLNYSSAVTKTCGKKVVASNKYEFWHKQLSNGKIVLSRIASTINGSTRDITYHDVHGKPTLIKKNNEKIEYEYYPDGLVKLKKSDDAKTEYTYEAGTRRLSSVKISFMNNKGKVIATRTSNFEYDKKGNLNIAENSEGQKVIISYDAKGRMKTIEDQAKKVVQLEYEERFGKPAVVTRPGLGSIKFSYKSNGEIDKATPSDSPAVASQIVSTFNNMLDVIQPAQEELYL